MAWELNALLSSLNPCKPQSADLQTSGKMPSVLQGALNQKLDAPSKARTQAKRLVVDLTRSLMDVHKECRATEETAGACHVILSKPMCLLLPAPLYPQNRTSGVDMFAKMLSLASSLGGDWC